MYDIAPSSQPNNTYLAGTSTFTTTNPPATIYIVQGDAGNYEGHGDFSYDQPSRTAFRTNTYGYGRMTVYNSTHLFWEQVECDLSDTPQIIDETVDSFWLIQENHGPFA